MGTSVFRFFFRWLGVAAVLWLTPFVYHDVVLKLIPTALLISLMILGFRWLILPILKWVLMPLIWLSLGVAYYIVNAALIWVLGFFMPGFDVKSALAALILALLCELIFIMARRFGKKAH